MKKISALAFAATLGLIVLAGCASPMAGEPSNSSGNMSMANGDMKSMCDEHKKMLGLTPSEQKAMMAIRMKEMTPEMRDKHMSEMDKCK